MTHEWAYLYIPQPPPEFFEVAFQSNLLLLFQRQVFPYIRRKPVLRGLSVSAQVHILREVRDTLCFMYVLQRE